MTLTWSEALDGFGGALEEEERSVLTIRNYRRELRAFAAWFEATYSEPPDPARMASVELREYKAHLQGRSLKPATINLALSSLKQFLRWLEKQGGPAIQAPRQVRQERPGPRWLNNRERLALQRIMERSGHRRDQAAVMLMLHAGLRIGEVVALAWADIAMSARKGTLIVRKGKGSKYREVPLNAEARAALAALQDGRPPAPGDPVFLGQRGPLTRDGLEQSLERYGPAAGLDGFKPHHLRHTFCRRLAEAGVRLEQIAALAGHESLDTTRRYVEPGREELAAAVERLAGGAE